MTEPDWLNATAPFPMLEFLCGKATNRKRILFGIACCRAIWERFVDPRCRKAVEATEGVIQGVTSKSEVESSWLAGHEAILQATDKGGPRAAFGVSNTAWRFYDRLGDIAAPEGSFTNEGEVVDSILAVSFDAAEASQPMTAQMLELHCQFLRCLFGNPFRLVPALDRDWLRWNNDTAAHLAQGIYDERAFDRLPVLADALEDAGCDDADVLAHCRSGGVHVRGCWVVDSILGKS